MSGHDYYPKRCLPRFPLELVRSEPKSLHICLWNEEGTRKWTIALVRFETDSADLCFVGSRPFDPRVNWEHFKEMCQQAQNIAEEMYEKT